MPSADNSAEPAAPLEAEPTLFATEGGDDRTSLILRDHQVRGKNDALARLQEGTRRLIVCAPTGAGKTLLAAYILRSAGARGRRVLFICDRIMLVNQTSAVLNKYRIRHGILMAGASRSIRENILICSSQTLERIPLREGVEGGARFGDWPKADLVVIDEAHSQRRLVLDWIQQCDIITLGLTATPMSKGMGKVYEDLINVATTNELIKEGWLVPLRVFEAIGEGAQVDMEGAELRGGEWAVEEVSKRGRIVIGDVVAEWERVTRLVFGGPVKTMVFTADTAQAEEQAAAFQEAGYDARFSTYKDSPETSERLVEQFRRGVYPILVSVDKYIKGFDVPDVRCLVDVRATRKNIGLQVQKVGRGMRPYPGKEFCVLIDHTGNYPAWRDDLAAIHENGFDSLDDGASKANSTRKPVEEQQHRTCKSCGLVLESTDRICPQCGTAIPRRRSDVIYVSGRVVEAKFGITERERKRWDGSRAEAWRELCNISMMIREGDAERALKMARGQYKELFGEWPPWGWKMVTTSDEIDDELLHVVNENRRRYRNEMRRSKRRRSS